MIVILCGKSGAGKDRIMKDFIKRVSAAPIVSYTTRPMREGEKNHREYHFVTKDAFNDLLSANKFSEVREYHTLVGGNPDVWSYGSPIVNPRSRLYVTILDMQGTQEYIDFYGKDNCFVVYVNVSDNERERRARARGSFDKTEWDRRLKDDAAKFTDEIVENLADMILDNESTDYDSERMICKISDEIVFSRTMKVGGR